jgi:adenylate kinase
MIIALTGTPGTGKTSVSDLLQKKNIKIIDLNKVIVEQDLLIGVDKKRKSKIVDIDRLYDYIKESYSNEDVVFLEGHISHLLKNVDKIVILRCHPDILKKRLLEKGWSLEKINENILAEILDIILCESLENLDYKNVFEINTTKLSINNVASNILEIIDNGFKHMDKYKVGDIDWSEEVLNWI